MDANASSNSVGVVHRLIGAVNAHDLPAFVGFIAEDYVSEQPIHPDRAFRGRAQVKENWSEIFTEIPDFHMDLLAQISAGNQVWAELDWSGTLPDKTLFHWRGIFIFTIEGEEVTAGRIYMEPVQEGGSGIDATVKEMTGH